MDIKTLRSCKNTKIAFYPPWVKSKEHMRSSVKIKLFQRTGSISFQVGSCLHIGILEIIGYFNWLFIGVLLNTVSQVCLYSSGRNAAEETADKIARVMQLNTLTIL